MFARDEERLALRDVRADAHRQLGVSLQTPVSSDSCHTSSLRIGTAVPSLVIPSTATSGPPIMKSVWTPETLMPRSRSCVGLEALEAVDPERDAGAVGDVARRVLVEERVEERDAGLADARTRRRRARPRRGACRTRRSPSGPARPRRRPTPSPRPLRRARSAPPGRARSCRRAAAAASSAPCPSVRRQSGQAKTSSVGRFGTCVTPSTVSSPPPVQRAPGKQPDGQVGARAR